MPDPRPSSDPADRLVGHAPAMHTLRTQIRRLAGFDAVGSVSVPTVLLHGETGTGKGLAAHVLHDSGPRARGPFIDVNCAAIPETMLEAELFGFDAGAFTDAKRAKVGLFEAASGGTLFLDEVDAVPLVLQSKLLKIVEEKRVRRLGAVADRAVDVKLIAATSADLPARVAEGRFRLDLYHRLAVVLLELPPLRARGEDIVALARQFLARYAAGHRAAPKCLGPTAEAWLAYQAWPGNVRELSHLMERVTLLHPVEVIDAAALERFCLPRPPGENAPGVVPPPDAESPDEPARIRQALIRTGGNVVRAARLLGLRRDALRYRMRRYGIQPPTLAELPAAPAPRLRAPRGPGAPSNAAVAGPVDGPPEVSTGGMLAWEHKPVAVLAVECTFPTATAGETAVYEPWTAASRWEQALIGKVQGFGGVVVQRSPALLLVVFGIPHTLEQQPQRAVQAALALRQLVAEGADHTPRPALRLVLHWGEVLVDGQARDPTAQLHALGETLAWPVRLLGQTALGQILLSAEMGPLVEGWCEVQPREVPLQGGQPGPIKVYAVVGNRPPGGWRERQGRRPLSPFVGRDQELATLREWVRQVEGSRGQVVSVMGDPGTGKSRLCDELVRSVLTPPWRILHTQATAVGQATPYGPIIDLLKHYFHLDDHKDRVAIRDQVSATLHGLDATLTPTVPAFLTLLEVPVEDPQWQALEPSQRRRRTLDALTWVLVRESQVQPVLLVCEDLHWIDTETQACLDTLVESLPTARLLLLVNYRPEYRHSWGHKTCYTQVRLDPLPSASAATLLRTLLGDDPSLAPLKTLLIERTEGNPFFLEESVQSLVDTRGLVGAPGAYRLAQAPSDLQVPATVQAVLAARIDRVPPEAKRLLQTAAVIGPEIPVPLLYAVAELSDDALHRGLAHLQAAEFLYGTRLFPDRVYTFKHALTQQVTYETLPQERRRVLHASIVAALEALAGDRLAEQVERLAHHALRGEAWDKAVAYGQQAGARAYDRAAFREAAAAFEQALQALAHLPEDDDTRRLAIDLRHDMGNPLTALGEEGRFLALLGEAETLARALDDRARLGRVLTRKANHLRLAGDHGGAVVAGQEALDLATALGNRTLQGDASFSLGRAYSAVGDFGRAAALLRQSVEAAAGAPGRPRTGMQIQARAWLTRTLSALGAFAEGVHHGLEALRLARLGGPGRSPVFAHGGLGLLYLTRGDLEPAIRASEQGLAFCRASGTRDWFTAVVACLGLAYALQGRLAEGRALLEEGITENLRIDRRQNHALWVTWLSEVCRLAGHREEAWEHARQALDLAREQQARGDEAQALYQLGVVRAHADPPDAARAEAHYQQALALADELGMRPLMAHCQLGLGQLYAKSGRMLQARAELSAAIDLYRSMQMTFWLPQAEAALATVGG